MLDPQQQFGFLPCSQRGEAEEEAGARGVSGRTEPSRVLPAPGLLSDAYLDASFCCTNCLFSFALEDCVGQAVFLSGLGVALWVFF